jgi:hypothetical protein
MTMLRPYRRGNKIFFFTRRTYELSSELLEDLRAADQPDAFYPLPACRAYLRDSAGLIPGREKTHATNEFPKYES